MKELFLQLVSIAMIAGYCLSGLVQARDLLAPHSMSRDLVQALSEMDATKSSIEVTRILSSIEDDSERATQILLASISAANLPEERNEILLMLFRLPVADKGLNANHIPLLVQLYVKSSQSPPNLQLRPRTFVDDGTLQSRILDILGSLLGAESTRATVPAGTPLSRLQQFLETTKNSNSITPNLLASIDESLAVLQVAIENENQDSGVIPNQLDSTSKKEHGFFRESKRKHIDKTSTSDNVTSHPEESLFNSWMILPVIILSATLIFGFVWKYRN